MIYIVIDLYDGFLFFSVSSFPFFAACCFFVATTTTPVLQFDRRRKGVSERVRHPIDQADVTTDLAGVFAVDENIDLVPTQQIVHGGLIGKCPIPAFAAFLDDRNTLGDHAAGILQL